MQTLINLLKKGDVKALAQHYKTSNESENIAQLAFVFQQGLKNTTMFEFYQGLGVKFIQSKGLPMILIKNIDSSEALSFFTPALQVDENFKKTNEQQRNVLHALLAGNQKMQNNAQPPFNYLRSMMLFESNETLHEALCQRDHQQLTPIEVYLSANQTLTDLPDHEFTALLAVIEIESKKQDINTANFIPVTQQLKMRCLEQSFVVNPQMQRLLSIGTYYQKSIEQVLAQINTG